MLSEEARQLFDEIRRSNSPDDRFDLETERHNSSQAGILTGDPPGVEFETTRTAGLRAIVARPPLRSQRRQVIFLHGGGFALMSPETHRRFAGHIANACRADVTIPAYSLAPEHPYPAALTTASASPVHSPKQLGSATPRLCSRAIPPAAGLR